MTCPSICAGAPFALLPALASTGGALVAGIVDARTGYIPDRVSGTTALAALLLAAACGTVPAALCGALAAGGALLALYLLTNRRGLGLGDVKLAAAIGLGFGPGPSIVALGAAFVAGGAYASWLLATRRARRGDAVRFGPFLAAGALAVAVLSHAHDVVRIPLGLVR
jgi:leader peptidase (prepilin peptidase)/N-methyltransferase